MAQTGQIPAFKGQGASGAVFKHDDIEQWIDEQKAGRERERPVRGSPMSEQFF